MKKVQVSLVLFEKMSKMLKVEQLYNSAKLKWKWILRRMFDDGMTGGGITNVSLFYPFLKSPF
jgi:hypothetical protein